MLFRPEVITAVCFLVRGRTLDGVGAPIDEQLRVASHNVIACQNSGLHTSPAREFVPWFENSVKISGILCFLWLSRSDSLEWELQQAGFFSKLKQVVFRKEFKKLVKRQIVIGALE